MFQRIAQYFGDDPPEETLLTVLLAAAIDPNPHRPLLIEDVKHSAFVRELASSTDRLSSAAASDS